MRITQRILILGLAILSTLFWGCDAINPQNEAGLLDYSCEGCHTNESTLSEIISDLGLERPAEEYGIPGHAGGAPSWTLTEKVWIRLNAELSIGSFKDIDSTHARIGCTGCHGGLSPVDAEDDTSAYRAGHSGVIRDPSAIGEYGCSGGLCHGDKVRRNETSMHSNLWGEKAHVALRNGYSSFDECPTDIQDGFSRDCASCHTTCGQCHVSIPNIVGGGFQKQSVGNSHRFNRSPDAAVVCIACHGASIGDDWNANQDRVSGNLPDVHNDFGFTCLNCHQEDFHGGGVSDAVYTSRYQVTDLPQCVDCHQDDDDDNAFHLKHWPNGNRADGVDLACFACHSQQYTSCNTCHAGGWKSEYEADNTGIFQVYPDFKLGHNPNYLVDGQVHSESEWITVRHVPVSKDAFKNSPWNIDLMSNYEAMETWKYTSPHSINRWTPRTLVDTDWLDPDSSSYDASNCYLSCHYHDSNRFIINADVFLKNSDTEFDLNGDVLEGELNANQYVTLGANCFQSACHSAN
ncbi:hypothetical protein HQ531_04315 [bacterium]|nr:hypothetical protein [bacterium]